MVPVLFIAKPSSALGAWSVLGEQEEGSPEPFLVLFGLGSHTRLRVPCMP